MVNTGGISVGRHKQNGREIRQRAQYEIPVLTELMGKHYYYTYSATIQPPLTAHSSMKVHPRTCHECPNRARERVRDVQLYSFFNLGARWDCEIVTPRPLYTWVRPSTHSIRGWEGLMAGADGCGKSRPPSGFDPRTVQPAASSYTDWNTPAHPLMHRCA